MGEKNQFFSPRLHLSYQRKTKSIFVTCESPYSNRIKSICILHFNKWETVCVLVPVKVQLLEFAGIHVTRRNPEVRVCQKVFNFIHKQTLFYLQNHQNVLVNQVDTWAFSTYRKLIEENELNFCHGIWEFMVLNCGKTFRPNFLVFQTVVLQNSQSK